jgi:hypothetical protein
MAFGPYTQPVTPAKWVDPLDLNMYAKGMMYKQEMAEKNLKSITDTYNSIMSIPAYGPDKQKLAEIDQQFRQQVGSLNISNLGDMGTMSQIKGVLGQYTTNADVLAIAQRGSIYESMLKEKNEADKKNKIYVNRGMNKLNKYFNGDEYIQNLKFGNDGYVAPDAGEIMESVKNFVTPDVKLVSDGRGNYQQVKYYDPEKLKKGFDMVTSSNPNWQKYHRDQVDEMFEDKDIDQYGKQYYQGIVQNYEDLKNKAALAMSTTTDKKKAADYQKIIAEYDAEIGNINKKLQNPYFGTSFKQDYIQKTMNQDINNMISAINFVDQGDLKMDRATEMSRQLNNDLYKMQEEEFYELSPYMSSEDRAKIGTSKQNEINLPGYKQAADIAKTKAAMAIANPNLTASERIPQLNETYKQFEDSFAKPDQDGVKIIVDDNSTRQRVINLLKARPDLFPDVPKSMIDNLEIGDIEISGDHIEIDNSYAPWGSTPQISQQRLIEAVQKMYFEQTTPKTDIGIGGESSNGKIDVGI